MRTCAIIHPLHLELETAFWGRASYRDIFENTKQHVTKFCRELTVQGDPTLAETVPMNFNHCPYNNCIDEDCERQPGSQTSR